MCERGSRWDTTMTRNTAGPWFPAALEDSSRLTVSDGTQCNTVSDVSAVWHCSRGGKRAWLLLRCVRDVSAGRCEEGCSAHCTVWQQISDPFQCGPRVGGTERGPRGGGWVGGGEAGSEVVWFLKHTASTIGRRSSAEMYFTMSLTLSWRRDRRAWSSWSVREVSFSQGYCNACFTGAEPGIWATWVKIVGSPTNKIWITHNISSAPFELGKWSLTLLWQVDLWGHFLKIQRIRYKLRDLLWNLV